MKQIGAKLKPYLFVLYLPDFSCFSIYYYGHSTWYVCTILLATEYLHIAPPFFLISNIINQDI